MTKMFWIVRARVVEISGALDNSDSCDQCQAPEAIWPVPTESSVATK